MYPTTFSARRNRITQAVGALSLAGALALGAVSAQAATFRWTRSADLSSWDIHAQNVGVNNSVHRAVYEALVEYNSQTLKAEPSLAAKWEQVGPKQLRITLREGVKFSDGSPLTADDVKFSLERAKAKTSGFVVYTQGIDRIEVVDGKTLDIFSNVPNPVLVNQLTELRIMSKPWAEKHNSVEPKDIKAKDENYAHRHALGTGPMVLDSWSQDTRLVLKANPDWWGKGKYATNLTEAVYTPIKSDATRTAALLSGEVDFIIDPSINDLQRIKQAPNLQVLESAADRTMFIGLDQFRDELPQSNVKGKNPFKDVRVRQALYQAIDMNTIQRVVMRGLAQPTGTLIAHHVNGWTKAVDKRLPFDAEASKKLLAQAGYPEGFEFEFSCPAGRYPSDEQLCQAISAQWAKVGIKAKLRTFPFATYFPMIQRYEASAYLLGWSVPTFDAYYSLQALIRTPGGGGDGNFNLGRASNPQQDAMIERVKTETDLKLRNQLIEKVLLNEHQAISHIPLFNLITPWAATKQVQIPTRADNYIDWRVLKVN